MGCGQKAAAEEAEYEAWLVTKARIEKLQKQIAEIPPQEFEKFEDAFIKMKRKIADLPMPLHQHNDMLRYLNVLGDMFKLKD